MRYPADPAALRKGSPEWRRYLVDVVGLKEAWLDLAASGANLPFPPPPALLSALTHALTRAATHLRPTGNSPEVSGHAEGRASFIVLEVEASFG